jgi:hypothetical protein
MNHANEPTKFVHMYALSSKLRLFASTDVLVTVEEVMRHLIQTYENPEHNFNWVVTAKDPRNTDILRRFSEACRKELNV